MEPTLLTATASSQAEPRAGEARFGGPAAPAGRLRIDAVAVRQGHPLRALLSEREAEVLEHLSAGRSNRQIASALFVSEETVKTHVRAVLRKLNVKDRTQAAILAVRGGVARDDSGAFDGFAAPRVAAR